MRRVVAALAAVLWGAPATAGAQEAKRVAILGVSADGVAEDVAGQFETVVEEGLERLGYHVTSRASALDVITSRELPEACAFGPCARAIGGALGVERMVDARISAVGQSYSFVLSMVDARSGGAAAQVVGSCPVCTVAEALIKVGDAIPVLEGGALAPAGVVRRAPRRSKLPPVLLAIAGAAAAGGGAVLVSQTEHDDAGWVTIGAGGTALVTGLVWLLTRD